MQRKYTKYILPVLLSACSVSGVLLVGLSVADLGDIFILASVDVIGETVVSEVVAVFVLVTVVAIEEGVVDDVDWPIENKATINYCKHSTLSSNVTFEGKRK